MNIESTEKKLTREAVFAEVGTQILTCEKAKERWLDFEDCAIRQRLEQDYKILMGKGYWLDDWLSTRQWAIDWLIEHGFAREVSSFQPFDIRVETEGEAATVWHKLNQNLNTFNRTYVNNVKVFGYINAVDHDDAVWKRLDTKIKEMDGKS